MTYAPATLESPVPTDTRSVGDNIDTFRQASRPAQNPDLLIHVVVPTRITVVYDETCELCRHARRWLEGQRTYVPLDFLPAGAARGMQRFADVPWLGEELVVVADDGRVWVGPAAFITAMWTTRKFRAWSYRLSGDTFSTMARHFFHMLTTERGRISALLKPHTCDGEHCDVTRTVETGPADSPIQVPTWPVISER